MDNLQILKSLSGVEIHSTKEWEAYRKHEIISLFSNYVYGVRDGWCPEKLQWEMVEEVSDYQGKSIIYKKVRFFLKEFEFFVETFFPKSESPVPTFVYIMHEFESNRTDFTKVLNCEYVPIEDITSRGYGVAVMPTEKIYPDWEHKSHYQDGVFMLQPKNESRRSNSWATISAWAWGAERVMDYLQQEKMADKHNIAVAGHSRGGKTALWCGANDERFRYVISNNSGCMGAAMLRGKQGEHIKDINITDWFCEKFHCFNEQEDFLPVDQHMLLALIAPRLLYVASSSEDTWADPESELRACMKASEVYELYGQKGCIVDEGKAEIGKSYHEGRIAYHVKEGKHGITSFDWEKFMDFWDMHKK